MFQNSKMQDLKRIRLEFDAFEKSEKCYRIPTNLEELDELANSSSLEQKHEVMYNIRQRQAQLDTENYYRSQFQREIQELIISGAAPFIYGRDFDENEVEIKEYNGFSEINCFNLLTMPRRGGKTEGICQTIAFLLLCVPNYKIIAISPSTRAAGGDSGLISHVKRIFRTYYNFFGFEANDERLYVRHSANDIRFFFSYPGGASQKYVFFSPFVFLSVSLSLFSGK